MNDWIKLNNEEKINLPSLLDSRLLVQANSGGGKSWLLRRILEQSHGKVQQIILDLEGEFGTLREKFDYILAGKGGDTPAEPRSAALLARKLLELKVSAIIDLYELDHNDRKKFVRLFLESMINAPKELWHPVMVVIDEAHVFVPQVGESEAANAVIDLATRGRKRGFCAVLATQRISKLHKDAAAECNNKLIGRTGMDIDMKRAADELGFTTNEQRLSLRSLKAGEFFAFGTAISTEVKKITIGEVQTSHPKAGARSLTQITQPTDKIKKVLGQLADLPKEAEAEAKTVAELKKENANLKREQTLIQSGVQVNQKVIEKAVKEALAAQERGFAVERSKQLLENSIQADQLKRIRNIVFPNKQVFLREGAKELIEQTKKYELPKDLKRFSKTKGVLMSEGEVLDMVNDSVNDLMAREMEPPEINVDVTGIKTPHKRILNALAWFESIGITEPEAPAVAFLAGYTFGGGGFNNPKGALRSMGCIEYRGGALVLTEKGKLIAEYPNNTPTSEELHAKVLSVLPTPEQRILRPLLEAYPEPMSNEALAEVAGYQVGSGGFNNPKGRLRTLGLVEYPRPGEVVAKSLLFI